MNQLTDLQFQRSEGAEAWRGLSGGAAAWFEAGSHEQGAALAVRIADLSRGRTLDIDIRATGVRVFLPRPVELFSDDDVALASAISGAVSDLGLRADPAVVRGYQVAIDTQDFGAVMPFWGAVLGHSDVGMEHWVDPLRRNPALWFQEMEAPRPLRNRIHLDVSRVGGQAADNAASIGGQFVGGAYGVCAADADGNEVDLVPEGPISESPEVSDWHAIFAGVGAWRAASAIAAAGFAESVAAAADAAGLRVKIDLRDSLVVVDSGKDLWETEPRFEPFAAGVQASARAAGLTAEPAGVGFVQIFFDAVDVDAVRAFWRAVLGYDDDPRDGVTDIVDPRRLGPELVFQPIEAPDPARLAQRNRIHIDLFVPDDAAAALVQTAIGAGGHVLRDGSPMYWTVADPEGNELDIAVVPGRQELFTDS